MLWLSRPPTRTERVVDAVLGVSRRRRRAAYYAIAGGVAVLRPLLRRVAVAAIVLALYLLARW
jgi:hypothetical protein